MRHAIIFLHHIPVLFRNVTFVNFFLRPGADKFRVKNVISCPASYIYYSTKQNDGVEDYLDQTDNKSFLETRSCYAYIAVSIESELKIKAGVT